MSNWDDILAMDPPVPFFTKEERARIDRVYRELQTKHDPFAEHCRQNVPIAKPHDYEMGIKVRDAERAAGLPRRGRR